MHSSNGSSGRCSHRAVTATAVAASAAGVGGCMYASLKVATAATSAVGVVRVAEVRFSLVLWGIWLNCEPEPNGGKRMRRTVNRTCRTGFELGLN